MSVLIPPKTFSPRGFRIWCLSLTIRDVIRWFYALTTGQRGAKTAQSLAIQLDETAAAFLHLAALRDELDIDVGADNSPPKLLRAWNRALKARDRLLEGYNKAPPIRAIQWPRERENLLRVPIDLHLPREIVFRENHLQRLQDAENIDLYRATRVELRRVAVGCREVARALQEPAKYSAAWAESRRRGKAANGGALPDLGMEFLLDYHKATGIKLRELARALVDHGIWPIRPRGWTLGGWTGRPGDDPVVIWEHRLSVAKSEWKKSSPSLKKSAKSVADSAQRSAASGNVIIVPAFPDVTLQEGVRTFGPCLTQYTFRMQNDRNDSPHTRNEQSLWLLSSIRVRFEKL